MSGLLDVERLTATRSADGAAVLVHCSCVARCGHPSVCLTQWSCGFHVVQSEWAPWPTAGNVADIEFRLPASCFETAVVVRPALLVGPDVPGRQRMWSHEFLTTPELTLEPVSQSHGMTA